MQESTYSPLPAPKYLPDDAPNILVVLIDDAGPALPDCLGGDVHTPNLQAVKDAGVGFNRFHTTAMCSPTRASLLTGRNHTFVGNGQICELANDWDGYSGKIPKSCALQADVLRNYGYATAAWGKWHNTPATEITAAGPFDNWPTGLGFEYFYGFLAGEASQYEPHLVRNTTVVMPPSSPEEGYHISEDLADDAINWLQTHKALRPDKPFYMYWASGALHGPHHVNKEWADKYKGKFDDGWDAYRERAFKNAKAKGWIPENAQLTPRHPRMAAWDSIPDHQKPFQSRLMEVLAGFAEHTDHQVGRILSEVKRLGYEENTLVVYIWGDNGSSGEGQDGTISELLAQNAIATEIDEHIKVLDDLGGLDAIGSPLVDNMYHAGWAWAGSTPYQGLKLMGAYFGGTRNPMAIKWPKGIKPDPKPRAQFHHCNDLVPTIYELVGITPPKMVNGVTQDPVHGTSFAYAFNAPDAPGQLKTQFFDIFGSRSVYHDGWIAGAVGPRLPWVQGVDPDILTWSPDTDDWELYNLEEDWSQSRNIADQHPEKLQMLKNLFLVESAKYKNLPIGGGLWTIIFHPEMKVAPEATSWELPGTITRIPEPCAPRLGALDNKVLIDMEIPENASGVLYKLGANSGGLTVFMDQGILTYEYNLFIIERVKLRSSEPLAAGRHQLEILTQHTDDNPRGPLSIKCTLNGNLLIEGIVPRPAALIFTANDCLDVGQALGSPVSMEYRERAPFKFDGTIHTMNVEYL
ncbi:arylsulfatase subfamily S1_4 [Synechococcus sp. MIT S9220]|nr:arylsulfatase subfamily S1_4 [Synechococcus sp. MIT S9220]